MVIRLTYGSWPASAGTTRRSRISSVGAFGKSDAVWPSGAEAVQDQVEGDAAHFLLIGSSGLLGVVFAPDAMHRGGSLLYAVEQ